MNYCKVRVFFICLEKKLVEAVKDVSEAIGGDKKQTESELLSKLLGLGKNTEEQPSATLRYQLVITISSILQLGTLINFKLSYLLIIHNLKSNLIV